MKELINYLASPVYSFTAVIILFALIIKYIDVFAKKIVGWIIMVGTVVGMILMFTDKYFAENFALTTDNVPILYLVLLVFWFLWYAIHKGIENDNRIEKGLPPMEGTPENREKVWAWPNLVYTELFAIIAFSIFLVVWSIYFKGPLEEPANPTWAPNPAKAPWYFLGLQEILVYFDPWIAGVAMPGVIIVGFLAIPYIDTNPKGNGYFTFRERKMAITLFLFGWLVLWCFLIIVGTFMRGPNWTFYGPFEQWDVHKVEAITNINLSEIVWVKWMNTSLPKNLFLREIGGIIATIGYMVVFPVIITKKWGMKMLNRMGYIRYGIFIFLFITMLSLPLKMYLRWFFNLKYILGMPEFEFNI
jgi:hypothetical protein